MIINNMPDWRELIQNLGNGSRSNKAARPCFDFRIGTGIGITYAKASKEASRRPFAV